MTILASIYSCQGNYDEAESLMKECLRNMTASLGNENPLIRIRTTQLYADMLYRKGDYIQAKDLYGQSLEHFRIRLGEDHPNYVRCRQGLTLACIKLKRFSYTPGANL